jgi:hypothetical protein
VANDPTIKIKIETDSTQAKAGLDQTAQKAEGFGARFKSTFAGVLAAGVVQNLASKVVDFGKQSVDAYLVAEDTQTKFLDSMSRIPGASDKTTKALLAQAKALSQTTVYSAGASKQALSTLASYGLNGDQLQQLLPLVQDYAAKTGTDLPTAAQQVGKAMLGQGRALKGVGINFKDTKTLAGNFAEVTAGLQDKVGGLATQMGGTDAGKMKIMQNQMTALKVQIGAGLVPAIEAVMPVLQPLMEFIAQNAKWLVPMALGIIAVAGAFIFLNFAVGLFMANPPVLLLLGIAAGVVAVVVGVILLIKYWDTITGAIMSGAAAVWAVMQTVWDSILGVIQGVWNWITANWPLLLPILFGPVGVAAALIITYWSQIWNAGLAVWTWIASAWNAVLGWLIAPFVAAWGVISATWGAVVGFFRGVVGGIAGAVSGVAHAVSAPFVAAWQAIYSGLIAPLSGAFSGVVGAISSALAGVTQAITAPFKAAFDFINNNVIGPLKTAWNGIAHAINAVHISTPEVSILGKTVIPGFDWAPPHVPTLQSGGLVTRTGLILAHAGEAVTPLPARARGGPLVEIAHAHFSERIDVEAFGRRLAWTVETAGV